MNTGQVNKLHVRLSISIESGINFLFEHQYPNGEFCCYYAPDDKMVEWCVPDSTVFPTALISTCLLPFKQQGKASNILGSAAGFLKYQMMQGGVWDYFTKWNPLFKYCPADVDDTVFASYVLQELNQDFPNNRSHLLANRNAKGLFYTWFVARSTKRKFLSPGYMKVMFREFKRPIHSLAFWLKHEVSRNDVDAVVNANVLFFLGSDFETKPVIQFLIKVIVNENEADSDSWYKNPFTLYYFISRNYKIIKDFEAIKDLIIARILSYCHADGSFNSSPLDTALAISTLLNFNCKHSSIEQAVDYLLKVQQSSGCWDRRIFFYSGPSKAVGWGSEEITTGYCLEALEAYRNFPKQIH
jgi:hypothetical protein